MTYLTLLLVKSDRVYMYLGAGLETGVWEEGKNWSLVNVLPYFLRLYYTSDGVTLGINHMSRSLEVCMFDSILISFIMSAFLSGWENFDSVASYSPASAIQWVILAEDCGSCIPGVSCNATWIWNQALD